jgi:hypothetical protein
MSAFVFYFVFRSQSAFKFEFYSNRFEILNGFGKKFSYPLTGIGPKPSRPVSFSCTAHFFLARFSLASFSLVQPSQPATVAQNWPRWTPSSPQRRTGSARIHCTAKGNPSPISYLQQILHRIKMETMWSRSPHLAQVIR